MSEAVARSRLAVYQHAVEAAGLAIRLAAKAPPPLTPTAEQLIRSAKEVDSHLRLLVASGVVDRVCGPRTSSSSSIRSAT